LPLKFTGIRDATSFGAACPQQATTFPGGSVNFTTSLISEDCTLPLILTVFPTDMRSN
jgi:carboxylesterase type B